MPYFLAESEAQQSDPRKEAGVTVVNEAIAAGNEVHAAGTWSDTFEEPSTGTIHAEGTYSWVLLHEGDTWRIRESTYDITNMRHSRAWLPKSTMPVSERVRVFA